MPVTDALTALHGTPTTPSDVFTSTTADYSDYELDFGAANDGSTSPYIPAFPSRTEAAYTFPPEIPGPGGVEFGVHLIIGAAIVPGSASACTVNVLSDATTAATTIIATRTLTLAQVGVAGAHYFIPVNMAMVARFLRANFIGVTDVVTSGTGFAWFGPKTGGEQ
jgi:hypothetical protein